MSVSVKMPNGEILIPEVKAVIRSFVFFVDIDEQNLTYAGKQLENSKTLAYYDIKNSLLEMLPFTYQIFLMDLDGKTHFLRVCKEDRVRDVKSKILHRFGVPVHRYYLAYAGKILKDDKDLATCNIVKHSHLHLVFRGIVPKFFRISLGHISLPDFVIKNCTVRVDLDKHASLFQVETRGQVSYFENREISGFQSSLSPLRADLSHTKWKFFNLKSMQEEEHVELLTFFSYIPNHIHRVTVKQLAHEKNRKNENGISVLLIPPELLSLERRKPQFSQANFPFANSYHQATLLALYLVKGVQAPNHHIPFSPLENMLNYFPYGKLGLLYVEYGSDFKTDYPWKAGYSGQLKLTSTNPSPILSKQMNKGISLAACSPAAQKYLVQLAPLTLDAVVRKYMRGLRVGAMLGTQTTHATPHPTETAAISCYFYHLIKGLGLPNIAMDSTEDEMKVYLKVIKTVALKVKTSETTRKLKALFHDKEGTPENLQELFFSVKQLEDDHKLVDHGIRTNSTLHLYLQAIDMIKLLVYIPSNEKILELEAKTHESVENIKLLIQTKEGILSEQFTLVYGGELLDDNRTLASLGIQSESMLHLVFNPRDVVSVSVKMHSGEILKLKVKVLQTFQDIKAIVQSMEGFEAGAEDLTYAGKLLEDSKTLACCNIKENSILEMLPLTFKIM
ncbi:uncharacterized protein LOC131312223 [Rhododendron vialii]|uniref:uncharacterized protein LOC131312223 n=1 Tax=Rhododendron vialii TaxID=182163 RepID=UPI002660029E|nr:uncharacterized protein LOC131312223 [Rhododendron vialii]